MTRYLASLATAATLAFIAVCVCVCVLVLDVNSKIKKQTVTSIDGTKLNAMLDAATKAGNDADTEELELASQYDETKPNSIPNRIYRLLTHTDKAVGRLDGNLNGCADPCSPHIVGVLPALMASLTPIPDDESALMRNLASATQVVTDTGEALKPTLKNLADASLDLSRGAADFATQAPVFLSQLVESSKNTTTTTQNVADTTGDIKAFVHRETAPVRGVWNQFKEVVKTFGPTAVAAPK
jgi:ABC-type transporter Mla subunit MlaD